MRAMIMKKGCKLIGKFIVESLTEAQAIFAASVDGAILTVIYASGQKVVFYKDENGNIFM